MCVVYVPECKQSSAQPHNTFISEFTPILIDHLCKSLNVLLLGDFNYHVNAETNVHTIEFLGLLECFRLKNHVEVETHIKGNTLDLVITRENELLPMDITTDTSVTSDHVAVLFGIPAPKPLSEDKTTKSRRWKSLDLDAFKSNLSSSDIHLTLESNSMNDAVTTYNTILQDLIDKHAPEYDRTFKPRHHTPWYNSTVRDAKRLRRKLERRWRKTQSRIGRHIAPSVRWSEMNWRRPSQNTITTNYLRLITIRMFIWLQTVYGLVQKSKNFPPMTQCKTFLSSLQTTLFRRL